MVRKRRQYIVHQFTNANGERIDAIQAGQKELQQVFDECAKEGYVWTIMEGPTLIFERTIVDDGIYDASKHQEEE